MSQFLTKHEINQINSRARNQNRTVEYVFQRETPEEAKTRRPRLRCVQAVIRDQKWVNSVGRRIKEDAKLREAA